MARNPVLIFGIIVILAILSVPAMADTPPAAMNLTAMRLDGSSVSLQDGRGKPALVIYWSPDSLASRKSMGELQRFADSPAGRNVFLLAISTSSDRAALQTFMVERQLKFPAALRVQDDLGEIADQNLPLLFVFDAEGRLLRRHAGMFHKSLLARLLQPTTP